MRKKNKRVNNNIAHDRHKLETWDDLIELAENNILRAKIRQEELTAAVRIYQQKRDAGLPLTQAETAG
jgi:hypothetical protein